MMRRESEERDPLNALVESDDWTASEVERLHLTAGPRRGPAGPSETGSVKSGFLPSVSTRNLRMDRHVYGSHPSSADVERRYGGSGTVGY